MVLITKDIVDKICRDGKLLHAYLIRGNTRDIREAQSLCKLLVNVMNCGIGIIPSLYSGDLISNNHVIIAACQKTLDMLRPHALSEPEMIVETLMNKGMIGMRSVKSDLHRVQEIIHAKVDELLSVDSHPDSYHVSTDLKLLGVNGVKYCDTQLQTSRRRKHAYTLKIHGITLAYDQEMAIEADTEYRLRAIKQARQDKIIRPVFRNRWLSARYDPDHVPSREEYDKLDDRLKAIHSYDSAHTNQFIVDYLFFQLLDHDHEGLINRHGIQDFRFLMKNLNPAKL